MDQAQSSCSRSFLMKLLEEKLLDDVRNQHSVSNRGEYCYTPVYEVRDKLVPATLCTDINTVTNSVVFHLRKTTVLDLI